MQPRELLNKNLYRLPWSLPDNSLSWLEITSACNLKCDGCYRENISKSHKSLDEVKSDMDVFEKYRNMDSVSIAGGDPLVHPEIIDIVAEVAKRGFKPVINTNGLALSRPLLRALKWAGLFGFTFHIDSKQGRPKWKGKNEIELNELRLQYAEMLADVGGISCAFNSTVYHDTVKYAPEMVEWAGKHIDIVHSMVFIVFRQAFPALDFDFYAGKNKIDMNPVQYFKDETRAIHLRTNDVVAEVQKRFPDFSPSAYLNGTEKADSFKWLISGRLGTKDEIFGYVGPRFMEMVQTQYHMWKGNYLAYSSTETLKNGKLLFPLAALDDSGRRANANYLSYLMKSPLQILKPVYFQTVVMIQPIDFLDDGGQNMCDACPDVTVWDGKLVWSCRLEEPKNFGVFTRTVPKKVSKNIPANISAKTKVNPVKANINPSKSDAKPSNANVSPSKADVSSAKPKKQPPKAKKKPVGPAKKGPKLKKTKSKTKKEVVWKKT
jgi:organic radical activating enzyme